MQNRPRGGGGGGGRGGLGLRALESLTHTDERDLHPELSAFYICRQTPRCSTEAPSSATLMMLRGSVRTPIYHSSFLQDPPPPPPSPRNRAHPICENVPIPRHISKGVTSKHESLTNVMQL